MWNSSFSIKIIIIGFFKMKNTPKQNQKITYDDITTGKVKFSNDNINYYTYPQIVHIHSKNLNNKSNFSIIPTVYKHAENEKTAAIVVENLKGRIQILIIPEAKVVGCSFGYNISLIKNDDTNKYVSVEQVVYNAKIPTIQIKEDIGYETPPDEEPIKKKRKLEDSEINFENKDLNDIYGNTYRNKKVKPNDFFKDPKFETWNPEKNIKNLEGNNEDIKLSFKPTGTGTNG
jgi:hypothetical protein